MTDSVFLIIGSTVHRAGLDGSRDRISSEFERATSMGRAGDNVMIIEGETLYRLNPKTGDYARQSSGWRKGDKIVCVGERTFVLEGTTLFESFASGDYNRRLHQLDGTTHLAGSGERLFSVEQGNIHELFFDDASYRVVCQMPDVYCLAASDKHVYVISDDGELFEIVPESGADRKISDGWQGASHMAFVAGKIVILDGATLCHAKLDGTFDVISREWERVRLMTVS